MREQFDFDQGLMDLHKAGMDALHHMVDAAANFQISETLINTIGIGIFVSAIWAVALYLNKPRRYHEGKMAKDKNADLREIRVKALVADGVTDFVEDAVFNHKLTRDESRSIYYKIGFAMDINDLIPKKRKDFDKLPKDKVIALKKEIKARINGVVHTQKKEETNVVPLKPQKKLGKLLSK